MAWVLAIVIACFSSWGAFALEKERPFFQSSRALAMGDAFTAFADGFSGPFYNPAGLALKQELALKIFDLEVLGSQDFTMFGKGLVSEITSLSNLMTEIQNGGEKNYSVGLNFLPQLLVKNFSLGIIGRGFAEGRIQQNSNMDFYSFADFGAYMQTAFAFAGGVFKFGGGIKILDRAEIAKTYLPSEYAGSIEFGNEWREGFGVGYDVGAIITLPIRFLPRFAISIQDLGSTKFQDQQLLFSNNKSPDGPPSSLRQRINTGFGLKIKHGRNVTSHIMGDVKDVGHAFKSDPHLGIADYIHAGWELNVRDILFLRSGFNQGRYWTGGLGIGVAGMGLELSTYGENVAFKGTARVDDRKYVGRYYIKF